MRKKIDEALGNWENETARVKQSIFEAKKKLQPMKTKRKSTSWLPYTFIAALLAITIGGIILWQQSGAKSGPVSTNETPTPVVVETHSDAIPHKKTLQILKLNYFYQYSSFWSEKRAEYQALLDVMSMYPKFFHMEKYNYTFPKDREEHYRNRAAAKFKLEMEDEEFKKYFTFINKNYGITEEEYIEHYLFVLEKFNFMQNLMHSKNIGFVDGGFPSGEVEKEYEAVLGISMDKLATELAEEEAANEIKVAEIPDAPLQGKIPNLNYGYNKNGEVVMSLEVVYDPKFPIIDYDPLGWILEGFMNFLHDQVYAFDYNTFKVIPHVNRVNLHDYVKILENVKGTKTQEANAKEAAEFLKILENSVDMEMKNDLVLPR